MSFGLFIQVLINIAMLAGLFVVFARLRRPAKDDPRLSKGLQLLSSKIAVLEDLNDRTEAQVNQMMELLDQKSKELQSKVHQADQHVQAVQVAISKSLEVSKIFQDKIPHDEIIERQQAMKYIKAARMAHANHSVEEIAREIDLPQGEIEFIAKVNRESLTFREEDLPEWAREPEGYALNPESSAAIAAAAIAAPVVSAPIAPQITPQITPQTTPLTTPAEQFRIEKEQAEKEALVQQLSRLQFEMQTLDLELASRSKAQAAAVETATPTPAMARLPHAAEATEKQSLEQLGEAFRQAQELEQAREQARQAAARLKAEATRTAATAPQIRKVQFPRIDSREM